MWLHEGGMAFQPRGDIIVTTRRITKIKDHDGKIQIGYTIVRPDGREDEHLMSCVDRPRPEFGPAMQAIAPTLAQWCDVPAEWCESLTVMGATITWANDIMGACVTAKRACSSSSPLIINAPHKPSAPYSEGGDEGTCLTEEQYKAILAIIEEAEAYLDGDRAQLELPMESDGSTMENDGSLADAPPDSEKALWVSKDANGTPTNNINIDKGGMAEFRNATKKLSRRLKQTA